MVISYAIHFSFFLDFFQLIRWFVPFSEFGSKPGKARLTESSTLETKSEKPPKVKLTRRDKCCNLGREVAKIGESCGYTSNVDHISPDKHFHQMKTAVWTRRSHPINQRLLPKCKPFKVFYEKCCRYEYYLIEADLRKAKKKIKHYLKQVRKNEVEEDQGSSNEEGGLPVEQAGISYKRHKL